MATRTLTDAERAELHSFIAADQARVDAENAKLYALLDEQRQNDAEPQEGGGAIFWVAAASLFAVGLAAGLLSGYFYRVTLEPGWRAAQLVGWLIVAFVAASVWRLWEIRK